MSRNLLPHGRRVNHLGGKRESSEKIVAWWGIISLISRSLSSRGLNHNGRHWRLSKRAYIPPPNPAAYVYASEIELVYGISVVKLCFAALSVTFRKNVLSATHSSQMI